MRSNPWQYLQRRGFTNDNSSTPLTASPDTARKSLPSAVMHSMIHRFDYSHLAPATRALRVFRGFSGVFIRGEPPNKNDKTANQDRG